MFKEQVPHACEIPPAILHLLSLLGSVSARQVLIGGIPVLVARESPGARVIRHQCSSDLATKVIYMNIKHACKSL